MDAYALLVGILAVVVGLAFAFFGHRLLESGSFGAYVSQDSVISLIAAIVLAIVGIVYQVWSTAELEAIGYARYRNPWWHSAA